MTITTKQLKNLSIFNGFKKEELKDILKISFEKTLKKDEVLFQIGEQRKTFFIVLEGNIAVLKRLGETAEIIEMAVLGEHLAELALFSPKSEHSHIAMAYSESAKLIGLPGKLFKKLPETIQIKLLFNLLPIISDNFNHASNRLMTIFQIGQILSNNIMTVDILGSQILKILLDAIRAKKALIGLLTSEPSQINIEATAGFEDNEDIFNKKIYWRDDLIMAEIITNKKVIHLPENEYVVSHKKVDYISSSVIGVPLQVGGKVIGVILLIDKIGTMGFSTNNEVLLNITAELVSFGLYQAYHLAVQKAESELKREYISL
jgi:CRP-like cAMP-binding protein